MKINAIVLSVMCVILVGKCEDDHHIEPRVLESQNNSSATLTQENIKANITQDVLISSSSSKNSSNSIAASFDTSEKLEHDHGALASRPSPVAPSQNSKDNNTIESVSTPQPETNNTKFNTSSLLRNNSSDPQYIGYVPDLSNTSTSDIPAPKVFPQGDSANGTKIIEGDQEKLLSLQKNGTTQETKNQTNVENKNQTNVEKKNQTNVENKNQTDTNLEQADLLNVNKSAEEVHQHPMESHEPLQINDKINDETEYIEDGHNTEDKRKKHNNLEIADDPDFHQRYLAAILVCSLVAMSVICYAVLLIWRRYLENRYGSRTMLVNEEDFDEPNDLRHFSI